ncbi:hypothetical protein N7497_000996 [Penicillium chrysogenum]|jgi:hypothetical protein|nr:hypothetical protein N7497_000996 [Penicillium chrysogenum]
MEPPCEAASKYHSNDNACLQEKPSSYYLPAVDTTRARGSGPVPEESERSSKHNHDWRYIVRNFTPA